MSKNLRTIIPVFLLSVSVVLLSGCLGQKEEKGDAMKNSSTPQASREKEVKSEKGPELPKVTGNVDDASNAILDSANQEGSLISGEETDASASISEDQEIDNLSNSYDENEL